MQLTTGLDTHLYCYETDSVRIVCPIAERRFEGFVDIVTPYGFSGFVGDGDCAEFVHHWHEFVKAKGYVCGYIGLNPIFENNTYFEPNRAYQYNEIYTLDLTLHIDDLYSNLSLNRRRQLVNWERTPSFIILDNDILVDFLLANFSEFFRRKNASRAYCFSRDTLSFLASLDNVLIIGAGGPEKVEAVTVLAHTRYVGDYLFNVSLPEGQHHSVKLLWHGLNHLKRIGVPVLNLGGGIRKDDGVAEFKRRFGSRRLPLRCLKQVYDPVTYALLCRRVKVDPANMAGYFPAYRSP